MTGVTVLEVEIGAEAEGGSVASQRVAALGALRAHAVVQQTSCEARFSDRDTQAVELAKADECVPIACAVAAKGTVMKLWGGCFLGRVPDGARANPGEHLELRERELRAMP